MHFSGRLDAPGVARLWDTAVKAVKNTGQAKIRIDLESVDYMDMAGATFISHISNLSGAAPADGPGNLTGVKKEFAPVAGSGAKIKKPGSIPAAKSVLCRKNR